MLRLGKMDVKGILRAVGMENVVKFTLLICEQGLLKAEEATKALGRPIRFIPSLFHFYEFFNSSRFTARGHCWSILRDYACAICGDPVFSRC